MIRYDQDMSKSYDTQEEFLTQGAFFILHFTDLCIVCLCKVLLSIRPCPTIPCDYHPKFPAPTSAIRCQVHALILVLRRPYSSLTPPLPALSAASILFLSVLISWPAPPIPINPPAAFQGRLSSPVAGWPKTWTLMRLPSNAPLSGMML